MAEEDCKDFMDELILPGFSSELNMEDLFPSFGTGAAKPFPACTDGGLLHPFQLKSDDPFVPAFHIATKPAAAVPESSKVQQREKRRNDLVFSSLELKLREGHDVLYNDGQAKFLNWTVQNPTVAENSGALLLFNMLNIVKEDLNCFRRGLAAVISHADDYEHHQSFLRHRREQEAARRRNLASKADVVRPPAQKPMFGMGPLPQEPPKKSRSHKKKPKL